MKSNQKVKVNFKTKTLSKKAAKQLEEDIKNGDKVFEVSVVNTTKKELLDLNENDPLAMVVKFHIAEISMKNDWRWKIKMVIHESLPDTFRDYKIKLEFDDKPFLENIDSLKESIDKIKTSPSMFEDIDKKEIKNLNARIDEINKEMINLKRECDDIEFIPSTEEVKWKDRDTHFLFNVLDSLIDPLNTQKYRLNNYRAILTPVYKSK